MIDEAERQKAQARALKDRENKEKSINIGDFIIPILSIIVLILLSVFIYIPMIKEGTEISEEIKTEKQNIATLNTLLTTLKATDKETMDDDYVLVMKMIPARMEVADFAQYIDQFAIENNLVLDKISASSEKTTLPIESVAIEGLYGVAGPLSYNGYYDDIVTFIDGLNSYSPYLVQLSSIEMNMESASPEDVNAGLYTDNVWSLEMSVVGFYIVEPTETVPINLYNPYAKYDYDENILSIIRSRASKLTE